MAQKLLNGDISFYVINSDGLSLFHTHTNDEDYPDPQLVSGLTAALMSFSSSLYNREEHPSYLIVKTRLGDDCIESRLRKYGEFYSLFLLKNVENLSDNAYLLLDKVGEVAVDEVREYIGEPLSKDLSSILRSRIEHEIEVIKEQIYSSYLLDILETASAYGVKKAKAKELIGRLETVYNSNNRDEIGDENKRCRDEIVKLAKGERSKTLRIIIDRINKKNIDVWSLFYVPTIESKEYSSKQSNL